MRFSSVTGAAIAAVLPSLGAAKELPKDEARAAAFYDNGMIHETLMRHKLGGCLPLETSPLRE
jgi:hypothetical protein